MNENDSRRNQKTVEEVWYEILAERGLEDEATNIIAFIQADPSAAFGSPDASSFEKSVASALDQIDFEDHGVDDPENLVDAMLTALEEGLTGERPGPTTMSPERGPPVSAEAAFKNAPADGVSERENDDHMESISVDMAKEFLGNSGSVGQGVHGARGHDGLDMSSGQASPSAQGRSGDNETIEEAEESFLEERLNESSGDEGSSAKQERGPGSTSQEGTERGRSSPREEGESDDVPSEQQLPPVPELLARYRLHQDQEGLQAALDVPLDLVDDLLAVFARKCIEDYEGLLKEAFFEENSEAEREILYEKLFEDRAEQVIRRRIARAQEDE